MQGPAIVSRARRGLDLDVLHLAGAKEQVVRAVDEHTNRKRVYRGGFDRRWLKISTQPNPPTAEAAANAADAFRKSRLLSPVMSASLGKTRLEE